MPEATPLLALVLAGKRAGGLMADAHHLHPWRLGAFNAVPRPHASDFTLVPGRARWLEAALLNGGSGGLQRLLLHDGHGRVLSLEARQREASPPTLVERDALLLRALDDHHAVCVRRRDGLVEVLSLPCGGPPRSHLALTAGMPVQAAHVLAQRRRGGIDGALCLELRARSTRYLLQAFRDGQPLGERTELRVPEDWRVLGLVRQADDAMPALLALRDDRRGLAAISADGVHALQRCTHDVTSASVSIRGDRVALVTLGGELVVLDEGGRRVLARVAGSEA
jgi:hypothetical protein